MKPIFFVKTTIYLIYRRLLVFSRDKVDIAITFGQTPLMAISFFLVFQKIVVPGSKPDSFQYLRSYNTPDVIVFLAILSAVWFGFSKAIIEIPKQINYYNQESLSFLSDSQFIISHYIALSIICLFQIIIFSLTFNLLFVFIPMYMSNELTVRVFVLIFIKTTALFWLISLASLATAMFISFYTKSISAANAILPFIIIVQILFGGSIIQPLVSMNNSVYQISQSMASRWGYEASCLLYENILPKQLKEKSFKKKIITKDLKHTGYENFKVYYKNIRSFQNNSVKMINLLFQETLREDAEIYSATLNENEQAFINKLRKVNYQIDKINLPDNIEKFTYYQFVYIDFNNKLSKLFEKILNKKQNDMSTDEKELFDWMKSKYPKIKLFRDINYNHCILILFIHIIIFLALFRLNYFFRRLAMF